jgi:hypothetical protein
MPLTPVHIEKSEISEQPLFGSAPARLRITALECIPLDEPPYDEKWLQELVYQNPDLVPAGKIEASFEDIIPVARELPLRSGALDNLYFTLNGYPVLVEVKLWKNHEARRKVVAQILEYAKDFTDLKYETLNAAIRKLRQKESWGENPLFEIVSRGVHPVPDDRRHPRVQLRT